MAKQLVDTSFITQWAQTWDKDLPSGLLSQLQLAYSAWYSEREPVNVQDDNDDLGRANNVVILGPTRDFQGRRVHKIFAEDKTRGRLFGYSIDLARRPFWGMSPLELGSFIGRSGLKDFEDFGHRESIPNKDYLNGLYYDEQPFKDLVTALRKAGLELPWDGRDNDYASKDYRRRSDLLRNLQDHVRKVERTRTSKALKTFMLGLDRTAYNIIRKAELDGTNGSTSNLTVRAYEWLCGCNEWHDGNNRDKIKPVRASRGDALRNRRDVGLLWGGLLEYIMGTDTTRAIEQGNPRIPTLTTCFSQWSFPAYDFSGQHSKGKRIPTTPEFVRWLRGRRWEEFHGHSKFQYDRLHGGFTVAAALPPQWRPRNAAEWNVFDKSERTIRGIAALLERDVSEVALSLAHIFNRKSDYPGRVLKPAKTVQDAFTANFIDHHNLGNLTDFLSTIPALVILPALVQTAKAEGFPVPAPDNIMQWTEANPISAQSNYSFITGHLARNMFKGMSIADLIKFANRWHQRLNRIQTRSMKLEGTYQWPALFDGTLTTSNGAVDMQCLTSTGDLVYAGNRLDNCVGGYTFKCIYGSSHIIQLENRATMEQALLEVRDVETEEGSGRFVIEQLQIEAPSNKEAAPWAVAAANDIIARINTPKKRDTGLTADLKALNAERKKLRDSIGMDVLVLKVGFDPLDTAYADNAYHVLHHEMRAMFPQATRAEYLAAKGISTQIPSWLKQQRGWNRPRV